MKRLSHFIMLLADPLLWRCCCHWQGLAVPAAAGHFPTIRGTRPSTAQLLQSPVRSMDSPLGVHESWGCPRVFCSPSSICLQMALVLTELQQPGFFFGAFFFFSWDI